MPAEQNGHGRPRANAGDAPAEAEQQAAADQPGIQLAPPRQLHGAAQQRAGTPPRQVQGQGRDGDGIAFGSADRRIAFEVAWERVRSRPELDLVADGAPLGSFDRFADDAPARELAGALVGHDTVWIVDSLPGEDASRTDDLLDDPRVREAFGPARHWDLGGDVHLWRLDAR